MAFWYFFTYAGIALTTPFVPVFLRDRGFTYTQIGQLAALAALAAFLTQNGVGAWSDRVRRRKPFILAGSFAQAFVYALFPYLRSYGAFVLVYVASGLASFTALTASSALVLDLVPSEGAGQSFASVRIWGSIGFVAMMVIGWAAPQVLSTALLFRTTPLVYLGAALSALAVPERRLPHSHAPKVPAWEGLKLLCKPGVPVLLIVVFLLHGSLQGASSALVLYMRDLGADQRIVHLAFIVSATIEIPFMLSVGRWSDRVGRRPLLAITGLVLPLRMFLYSLIRDPRWVPAVQSMHGLTYAVLAVVPMAYMNDVTPDEKRAAGQGLLSSVMAGAVAFGPYVVGVLGDRLGLSLMYRALAVPSGLAGLLLFLSLRESNRVAAPLDAAVPLWMYPAVRPVITLLSRGPFSRE